MYYSFSIRSSRRLTRKVSIIVLFLQMRKLKHRAGNNLPRIIQRSGGKAWVFSQVSRVVSYFFFFFPPVQFPLALLEYLAQAFRELYSELSYCNWKVSLLNI